MNPRFYLFLPNRSSKLTKLNSVELNWVYEDENNELNLAQGLLGDAAKASLHHHVTVVLPGEDVLFLTAEVPGKNNQRIRQAVPYVLEDNVIDDVDNLYFAIQQSAISNSASLYDVSIINKEYFEFVVSQLETMGLHADVMIADYWLLPDSNTLFHDGKRVIFNGSTQKFSFPLESKINLKDYGVPDEQTIKLIDCGNESDENYYANQLIDYPDVKKERCDGHPLLCFVKNSEINKGINLLQGAYKKKKNWSHTVKVWMPAAALFLVWLSVQGTAFIINYISLSKQNTDLNTEIVKIYKATFPESRKIIDAKIQMQQKLNELKKRKGQSGRSFSEMLSGSASVFAKTAELKIKTLRYYDGRINLELQIGSLQALDKLKRQLSKENGYQVDIQNASSGKEKVTARLQIIGAEL